MSADISRSLKQYTFKFGTIASASLGIVLGLAVFGARLTFSDYAEFWFLITICLSAAFIMGLIADHLFGRLINVRIFPKFGSAIKKVRLSVEHRFKGDRTDEEYRRVENGIFVPIGLLVLVAMLFVVGAWTVEALITLLFLWLARNVFITFNASTKYGVGGLVGWTFTGFFLALLFGFFS
ncbi:hypothetical protein [Agrobacterium rosae]|uniref:MAPEG family protein n=1 Tax=Agrobacterium rosae TaxID=1972867 RepID=A0AAW9FBW3_9HYPH|nr:hypothetical protein [Agrobacterium rosae]MDX8301962.1 hypothetical protein [Agrobacterium rosae]